MDNINFNNVKIRSSALGLINTEPRGKTNLEKYNEAIALLSEEEVKYDGMKKELKSAIAKAEKIAKLKSEIELLEQIKYDSQLSETCKSYLVQTYILEKYGRVKEVSTKEMKKGILVEDDSINLVSIIDGILYSKNTERFSNDFITGTPDIINGNEIIDIKSSWDIFTFLSNIQDPISELYYAQLQGYMALTGATVGTIAYCLTNTPDSIIEGEKYALLRNMDAVTEEDPAYKRELAKLERNRRFSDIPIEERVLTFSIERDNDYIEKTYRKVEKCREFLYEFEQSHLSFSKHNRKIPI
jgi:hypothetical protein